MLEPNPINPTDDVREPISGLYPDVLARFVRMVGYLPDVFLTHQQLEKNTGQKNIIGRQNLAEALAHGGTLFQRAHELDRDGQLEQMAYLEDHLRRVLMESFEIATYAAIGTVRDPDSRRSLDRRYHARAAPLIRVGRLAGHVTPTEVTARYEEISNNVVAARRAKVADEGWERWLGASDILKEATKDIAELQRDMRAALDAATASWRFVLAIGLALVLFALSHVFF